MAKPSSNTSASVEVSGGQCNISGVLDFNTTRVVLNNLRPVIQQHENVEINLASVSSANSAGLALLVECKALATQHSHNVQFLSIPEGLLQLAGVCEVNGLI